MVDSVAVTSALNALRAWRTLTEDRNQLVAAAHGAGASQVAIAEAAGLTRNTVKTILDSQETFMSTTATRTADPLAAFHHSHYLGHTILDDHYDYRFDFRPFTGAEPEPPNIDTPAGVTALRDRPDIDQIGIDGWIMLRNEYWHARGLWAQARFLHLTARAALLEAVPVWEAFTSARALTEALFEQFTDLSDDRWNSQTLKLLNAHDAARDAAEAWVTAANNLLIAQANHDADPRLRKPDDQMKPLTIAEAAAAAGIDITGWKIPETLNDRSLNEEINIVTEAQRHRLEQVTFITGKRSQSGQS